MLIFQDRIILIKLIHLYKQATCLDYYFSYTLGNDKIYLTDDKFVIQKDVFVDVKKYKNQMSYIYDNLLKNEYIFQHPTGAYFYLSYKGIKYFSFSFEKAKNFIIKSVLTPIIVSIITAIITVAITLKG